MSTTVVITGLGTTNPLAGDTAGTWEAMMAGRSGIRSVEEEWAAELPSRFAGQAAVSPDTILDRVQARKLDRSAQLAVVAGREAWADAGLDDVDPTRLLVSVGTGIGGLISLVNSWEQLRTRGVRRVSPLTVPMLMANAPAANIGLEFGAKAGIHTPVSACASGNEAISLGLDQLLLGRADVAVIGGTEGVVHALPMAAFAQMQALSRRNDEPERASRPWDVDRDGFVLAEGAAILVVETLEHATARGAKIYGTLAGAGITADGHDIVQPDPTGGQQGAAMVKALKAADASPSDVSHVNAHATSTPLGDTAETKSIRHALGSAVDGVVVSGTKSMTGHLLGGAGALETLACVLAVHHRTAPPTINLDNQEEGLGIDIATSPRDLGQGDLLALNNSFGFGGHNVAIAVSNANANR
ncbi:beta-ketoacyl-[acyl-carrier-protein] synthase family protein [Parenemella sanctibonifatiensis]|uniref:Beta-ketoacyl-[acyl-carrier-protein] synthase II n=1 Tax=Parenemella sanctibonifatiensis TaxID=2016505 RepID=A0A255EIM6_9ACTN|nr:beta-ketoacyl-[acyl-carrier-protein] synthase family protein [Parenemella sanctibonifatiensis]OYN90831.1 beta-ketoacyl-[acyl-carrier-protein] synthase II [Parenemella sanctibonifatiensis]